LTLRQTILTILTVMMLAVGQVLFKLASGKIDIENKGYWAGFLLNPTLLIALCVYGAATVAWLFVLRTAPLRVAYPFVALAFVIVPLLAAFFLGEPLRWTTFAGAACIIVGVWVSLL
jgi:undecaprenyl phosphate-alpha-L-ara4N flippase subunit ArnE